MSNLAAAFEGASQGLDQMAGMQAQKEMQEAMATRAENLAYLKNHLAYQRESSITQLRGNILGGITQARTAAEHKNRVAEIGTEEADRAKNLAAAQKRQSRMSKTTGFVIQNELRGRAARVQAARDAVVQANQARQDKANIRTRLTKYQQQNSMLSANPGGGLDSAGLAEAARHDSVLASQLQAYKAADAREQAATRAMGQFPNSYAAPGTPGAPAPSSDTLASPPTSSLIPLSEGPGIADQPYPAPTGADETYMFGGNGGSDSGDDGSDY